MSDVVDKQAKFNGSERSLVTIVPTNYVCHVGTDIPNPEPLMVAVSKQLEPTTCS